MLNGGGIIGGRSFLLSFEKPSMPHALPGNQERSWGELGAKNTPYRARPESDKPSASKPRSRPRHKSAESPCVVLRLAYDPLPVLGGLLPRRHLRRLSGIFPHVADREPLDLNSLLRLLRSHLECIRFRPTRQIVSWRIGSALNLRVCSTFQHFFRRLPCQSIRSFLGNLDAKGAGSDALNLDFGLVT